MRLEPREATPAAISGGRSEYIDAMLVSIENRSRRFRFFDARLNFFNQHY